MTRAERAALEAILKDATQARAALDMFELDQESPIGTALLAAPLNRVIEGLRKLLGNNNEHLPDTDQPA